MKNLLSEYKKIAKHTFRNFTVKQTEKQKEEYDYKGYRSAGKLDRIKKSLHKTR